MSYAINSDVVKPYDPADDLFDDVRPTFAEQSCLSEAQIAVWTNRVPKHEPWPRVMMQDSDDEVNEENDGYLDNVDWIEQYDNVTSPAGREPIGKVEGDETIERNPFWRR